MICLDTIWLNKKNYIILIHLTKDLGSFNKMVWLDEVNFLSGRSLNFIFHILSYLNYVFVKELVIDARLPSRDHKIQIISLNSKLFFLFIFQNTDSLLKPR